MAIIECKECKHNISNKAKSCPNCGAPITKNKQKIKEDYEEITIYNEATHPLTALIYVTFFSVLIVICLYDITLIQTFRNSYSLIAAESEQTFTTNTNIYSSIIINSTFIACIMTSISKRTFKISKFPFIINLITHIIFFKYLYSHNFRVDIQFYILYILNIIFLLLPRFNKLEQITKIVKKDKIEKLSNKSTKLEEYYNKSIYDKKYKITLLILTTISILSLLVIMYFNHKPIIHHTVIQDKTDYQIEITNDYINVREKPTTKSKKIGEVNQNDIYNVIDIVGGDNYIWYKIKYNDNIGYISSDRYEPFVKELYSDKLIINIFCKDNNKCNTLIEKLNKYKEKNDTFLTNYLDITDKSNKNIFNKIQKYYKDKNISVPYVVAGTERLKNDNNLYKNIIEIIKHPVDKELNLVDIIKKNNELPVLKPSFSNENGSVFAE